MREREGGSERVGRKNQVVSKSVGELMTESDINVGECLPGKSEGEDETLLNMRRGCEMHSWRHLTVLQ